MEFDINFIINISSLFDRKVNSKNYQSKAFAKNRRLNFLAKAGVGLNMFRTLRQELKTEQDLRSPILRIDLLLTHGSISALP